MKNVTLKTENEGWGFWGSMKNDAEQAWPLAFSAISAATGESPEAVRAFLDSRHGRYFADDVLNAMIPGSSIESAVQAATVRWMDWKIGKRTARELGIPKGLPYLTGFVIYVGEDA